MVLKLELKRCANLASTTYIDTMKTKLIFKLSTSLSDEKFPNPARKNE